MKIIVCIKIVPDINILDFDLDTGFFDSNDFVYMINPLDLIALEAALTIKESMGAGEVICITIAQPSMTKHFRKCLETGCDEAIMLCDDAFDDSDGFTTASILASAIKKIGFDLILCGSESHDGDGGMVGQSIAAMLDIPHASAISKLEASKNKAQIHRALERGEREALECSLPALFTVHQTMNIPRYPTFPSSLAALKKEIPVWDLHDLGLNKGEVGKQGSLTSIINFTLPRPRPKVTMRMDSSLSPQKRMKLLVSGGITEKQGEILKGDPKNLAEKLVNIIRNEKAKAKIR